MARTGNTAAAVSEWEALIQIAPDHVDAVRALARLYGSTGRWQDAIRVLEAARTRTPLDPRLLEELGDAEYGAGMRAEANALYSDAERLFKDTADLRRVRSKRKRE